jgi:hypothetical protein
MVPLTSLSAEVTQWTMKHVFPWVSTRDYQTLFLSFSIYSETGYSEPWYQQDPSDDEPRQLYELPTLQPSDEKGVCRY